MRAQQATPSSRNWRRLVRDAAGRPQVYVGQVQDLTAQKRAETELRASEGRLRAFFDSSTVAMVEVSPDAR
jgi:two-component system, cell cycle sensor histidine kinase and response regulator CckA